VIGLTSTKSGQGKTNLLYYLTVISILPRKESAVVWLDTDNRFSALRLLQVTRHHLAKSCPTLPSPDQDAIATEVLRHVHIFQPQSSTQLLNTLHSLTDYLLNTHNHNSGPRTLSLLILDSATSFHWQDRFDSEIARLEADPETPYHSQISKTLETIRLLKALQQQFDCALLYTTSSASTPSRPNSERSPDPGVGPWTGFATVTLTLARRLVPQFAADTAMEECLRDQRQRLETLSQGRFIAAVDWNGSNAWASGVRDAIETSNRKGLFEFRVTTDGVEID
jgi:hypothetical protein